MPYPLVIIVIFIAISAIIDVIKNRKKNSPIDIHNEFEPQEPHIDNLNGSASPSIQHEIPEDGYVVLNGVKRRLEDCKYL